MSKFIILYDLIMEEILKEACMLGNNINNLPKSKSLGLQEFNIGQHAQNRDFERCVMDEIGYTKIYSILDNMTSNVIKNRKIQISTLNRFCGLIHEKESYFKIIIGFNNKNHAFLATLISITKQQYNNLINKDYYIDSNDRCNFIILKN